ncbi:MAG: D-alanine--D-alanine ligase family protein [Acidimicrobiales bacterium]
MPDDRIDLIVLFGGQSAEHDVSRSTARHVLGAIDLTKYRVQAIGITRDGRWVQADDAIAALTKGVEALPERLSPDGPAYDLLPAVGEAAHAGRTVVVFPLLHGPLGEDGTVQGLLELAGVPYVGAGVLSSALAMDKAKAKEVLAFHGIAQAHSRSIHESEFAAATPTELVEVLGLPMFVKPANLGSSVGVSKAKTLSELQAAIDLAFSYDEWIVVEEAIQGREIECAVLGNLQPRASLPGEVRPKAEFYDYDEKYLNDTADLLVPAPLTPEETDAVQRLSIDAYKALRCEGMARVDFFYEEYGRGFLVNELNTIPGFTPISMYPKMWAASGLSYPQLVDELVQLAIERHGRRRRRTDR